MADSSAAAALASQGQKRPKSPPLAFAKTSNDSLLPLIPSSASNSLASPNRSAMGRLDPPSPDAFGLQLVVDQQNMAIQLLHDAFAAERQSWILERESLHQRIAALERLLRNGDHHSPAKSPILSPLSRPIMAPQLPSIAEHEKPEPLSRRRSAAPTSIELPPQDTSSRRRTSSVAFAPDESADIVVETIPSRPSDSGRLSPPPLSFRRDAGHTPLHSVRPPTPPPKDSLSMAGIEDTPTRRNTHINTLLTQSSDEESDKALSGPLNLPELPSKPTDTNFTLEMLSRKLEQIEQNPDDEVSKPLVFAEPSPGLASPTEKPDYMAARTLDEENPAAPIPTCTAESNNSSKALSPGPAPDALSPTLANTIGAPLSPQSSRELQVQQQFEQGGIKLKKRPSVNFGAPFGTLGGLGGPRRQS